MKDKTNTRWFKRFKKYNISNYNMLMNNSFKINKDDLVCASIVDQLSNSQKWVLWVPCQLINKLIDHGHHNPYLQHFGQQQTYWNLSSKFWWPNMRHDINYAVRRCIVCQFKLGTIKKRAPLLIRELPKPREHVMGDFIVKLVTEGWLVT